MHQAVCRGTAHQGCKLYPAGPSLFTHLLSLPRAVAAAGLGCCQAWTHAVSCPISYLDGRLHQEQQQRDDQPCAVLAVDAVHQDGQILLMRPQPQSAGHLGLRLQGGMSAGRLVLAQCMRVC